jgi:putative DNA primase/helicase
MSAERFADRDDDSPIQDGLSPHAHERSAVSQDLSERRVARVRDALIDRAQELVTHFLGKKPTSGNRRGKVRWGTKGSFELTLRGRFKGCYYDFEAGEHGDLFSLIMRRQGLTFVEAVEWAARWVGLPTDYEPAPEETKKEKAREAARRAKEPVDAAEDAAKEAKKLAFARKNWDEARPIDGTLGEQYLYETRKIHLLNFPASIRWSIKQKAIICAVTDSAGELVAIQLIAVTSEGRKDVERWQAGAKMSFGPVGKGVVRLPGAAHGPLCICEGIETGLTVWAATGNETWVLLGGMRRAAKVAPAGRRIIVCRDDDKINSPAANSVKAALRDLRAKGMDVREAWPHAIHRGDKSDFNDVAQERGLGAVRERIELAASDMAQALPEFYTRDEARVRVASLIAEFFHSARQWLKSDPDSGWGYYFPPVHAIGLDVGGGKTEAAINEAIRLLVELRSVGDKRVVVILVPEHRLAEDIEKRVYQKLEQMELNLRVRTWRGRAAKVRPGSDECMCEAHETVDEGTRLLAKIPKEICCEEECIFFDGCQYRLQQGLTGIDLWIGAHNLLFHAAPTPIKESGVAALVVDEGPMRAGLKEPVEIPLDAIDFAGMPLPKNESHRLELMNARHRLARALSDEPDGYVKREAFAKAPHYDIDAELARSAICLEWERIIKAKEEPDWRKREGNRTLRRMVEIWDAVAELVGEGGPDVSGRLKIIRDSRGVRSLSVTGRSHVHFHWNAPTLLLDALHDPELIRPFWETVENKGHVRIAAPFMRVRQAVDKSYSLTHLSPVEQGSEKDKRTRANNRRSVRALILRLAREAGGRTLVVGNKSVVQAMEFPSHIEIAWFGAVAGRDSWKDVRLIVILGRPQPRPSAVEWMAGALTGHAVPELGKDVDETAARGEPAESWYPKGDAFQIKRDGEDLSSVLASADRHPHELCERIRWRICQGEIVQPIGRGRGVNRDEATPLDVVVLNDVPLPLPVDQFLPPDAVTASPIDLMLAEGGVAFFDGSNAATAYPSLWTKPAAARMALSRARSDRGTQDPNSVTNAYKEYLIGKCYADPSLCPPVRFQRLGPKLHEEMAIYDPQLVPDPRSAVEAMLGELAMFEIVGQARDAEAGRETREGVKGDVEAYLVALRMALDEKGRIVPVDGHGGHEVFAVEREEVREEFKRRRPVDPGNSKGTEARKKAFERGEKKAQKCGVSELIEVGGRKFVWLVVDQERDDAPQTAFEVDASPIVVTISNAIIWDFPIPPDCEAGSVGQGA